MDIYMLILANPDGYAYTHTNVSHYHSLESCWISSLLLLGSDFLILSFVFVLLCGLSYSV